MAGMALNWIVLWTFLLPGANGEHPFYVSNTIAHYNEETATIQISSHIFLDDLEKGIHQKTGVWIKYGSEKESLKADSLIYDYLSSNMQWHLMDTLVRFKYIGAEMSEDFSALWCYLESPEIAVGKAKLDIENHLLMEVYDDQKNIVHFNMPDEDHYFLFRNADQKESMIVDFPGKTTGTTSHE
jgi:hypothetical protein